MSLGKELIFAVCVTANEWLLMVHASRSSILNSFYSVLTV